MWIRAFILAAAFCVWAQPSQAAPADDKKKDAGPTNIVKASFEIATDDPFAIMSQEALAEDNPQVVDVALVPLPVARNGRLTHYLFISLRYTVADGRDAWKLREKSHHVRDALLRGGHRAGMQIAAPDNPYDVNPPEVLALAREAVEASFGDDYIADVRVLTVEPPL